jgi:hypothetical protein
MFYPELKMPYMPISKAISKGLDKVVTTGGGNSMESMEAEEMEIAMVCFFLSRYEVPS